MFSSYKFSGELRFLSSYSFPKCLFSHWTKSPENINVSKYYI